MRYSQSERYEMIRLVENSELSARRVLREIGIAERTFYDWYGRYKEDGYDGLADRKSHAKRSWNRIPKREREKVREIALTYPEKSPRELAWYITDTKKYYISESSVYRILREYDLITSPQYIVMAASDKFKNPTRRINELWQTDFTYFKVYGWGWYYLSTVLDDYSRKILSWKLFTTMNAQDVQETLDMARELTYVDKVHVKHRPRLLSDNGPCYLSKDLKDYLDEHGMEHSRGKPYHPQTQGKIERYHQSMKNVIKLDHYFMVSELEEKIAEWVEFYNTQRLHESLGNVTPDDMYYGRQKEIFSERLIIKQKTLRNRKRINLNYASFKKLGNQKSVS